MKTQTPTPGLGWLAGRRARAAAGAFSMQVAGAGLSLLVTVLIAKLIGVTGLGLFFLSITVVEIGATVARLGLENAGLKSIAIARNSGDRARMATLYRRCIGIAALSATGIALLGWALLHLVSTAAHGRPELLAHVPLLACALIPVTLLPIQTEALKAIGRPGAAVFFQTAFPQGLLLLAGAVLAWHGRASIDLILAAYALAFGLAVVAAGVRWSLIVRQFRLKAPVSSRELLRTSLPMLAVSSLNLAMAWTDTLALGLLSDAGQVGIYGVALRIATTTSFIIIAVASVVAAESAALHAGGRHAELDRLIQRSTRWTLVAASPPIFIFLVFPAELLSLFGDEFAAGAWPLRILALAQLVNVSTGHTVSLLIMTGHAKGIRNIIALSAALNVAGNLMLVPLLGALGAAISTASCIVLMKIIAWRLVRRTLGINTLGYLNPLSRPIVAGADPASQPDDARSGPG